MCKTLVCYRIKVSIWSFRERKKGSHRSELILIEVSRSSFWNGAARPARPASSIFRHLKSIFEFEKTKILDEFEAEAFYVNQFFKAKTKFYHTILSYFMASRISWADEWMIFTCLNRGQNSSSFWQSQENFQVLPNSHHRNFQL